MEGIKLTPRDNRLLLDVYRHMILSYSQIHKRHFPGKSLATVSNRLGQLCRTGYLRKHRISVALLLGHTDEVGVVFQVTRKGHGHLRAIHPDITIREEPHRLNLATLGHDLLLNEAIAALEKRFPGSAVVHGRLLPVPRAKGGRCPDAAIVDQEGKGAVAVELELTAKSDARYREIVLQYQLSVDYPQVLYIVPGRVVADKVKFNVTQRKEVPGLPPLPTGKFFFVTLHDLLTNPSHVPLTNGSDELFVA